jgi:hypothetical protein
MADYGSGNGRPRFSDEWKAWFRARGGVLVHLGYVPLGVNEHYVGVGVDEDTVYFDPEAERKRIVFDFPRDSWQGFNPERVERLRVSFPSYLFVGSGPDSPIREFFDEWSPYGQTHAEYVKTFRGAAAFFSVPGESMGLAVAEAQMSGAAIVSPARMIPREMICPTARVLYLKDARAEREAFAIALSRDPRSIVREARHRFDFAAVARRVALALQL